MFGKEDINGKISD